MAPKYPQQEWFMDSRSVCGKAKGSSSLESTNITSLEKFLWKYFFAELSHFFSSISKREEFDSSSKGRNAFVENSFVVVPRKIGYFL